MNGEFEAREAQTALNEAERLVEEHADVFLAKQRRR